MKKQTKLGLVLAAAAVISVSVASLVSARGWVQQGADWYYVDNSGEYVTDTIQSSGNAKFYLGEEGTMQRDYLLQDYNGQTYYFGSNGAMVTNTWVAVDSTIVDSGADYIPDNFWFYFQGSGKAVKAASGAMKRTTIDGKKYAFSEDGTMLTGWIKSEGKTVNPDDDTNPFSEATYYAGGDNDGILRTGWVTYYDGYDGDDTDVETDYTNLYFYFNTSNNKKYGDGTAETKKINGRTYAFSNEGVMLSGWDAYAELGTTKFKSAAYFSGEDDGHQVKKGWVFATPHESIDRSASEDYDDEAKYMYFNSSGAIIANQVKKINNKHYVFDNGGIMQTGIIIWRKRTGLPSTDARAKYKYISKLDLDWANGSDLSKKGKLVLGDDPDLKYILVNPQGEVTQIGTGAGSSFNAENVDKSAEGKPDTGFAVGDVIKMHYFGDDGARKTGTNQVEFADDTYAFTTTADGNKASGPSSKKYYALGIQLKASADIKYGVYVNTISATAAGQAFKEQKTAYTTNLQGGNYFVLNASGAKVKGKDQSYKDADGNYWLINKKDGTLQGIWTVNVKKQKTTFTTVSIEIGGMSYSTKSEIRKNGTLVSHADFKDLCGGSELFDDTIFTQSPSWTTINFDKDADTVAFKSGTINTTWFRSDYGDKSNIWIPFGFEDVSGNTCTYNINVDDTSNAIHAYEVIPNDDYFVNCYWTE